MVKVKLSELVINNVAHEKKKSGYHFKLTMQHAQYDVLYKTIFRSCTKPCSVLNVLWQCLHYNIQHCDFAFVE